MAAYINGYSNSMDVLGFGFTTQSAMFYQSQHAAHDVHEHVQCDGCGANPLRGIRWRCKSCPDHDICNNCKKQNLFPDHPFEIMSMTASQNQHALATGGQVVPQAGVHWTTCRGCGEYPIKNTVYACTVCPGFDLCHPCNTKRIQTPEVHPHRFDFFVMPRPCNPPPSAAGGAGTGRPPANHGPPQQAPPPTGAPPQSYLMYGISGQPSNQQQGYAPPPPPYYHQPQSTSGKVYNWFNKHLEFGE